MSARAAARPPAPRPEDDEDLIRCPPAPGAPGYAHYLAAGRARPMATALEGGLTWLMTAETLEAAAAFLEAGAPLGALDDEGHDAFFHAVACRRDAVALLYLQRLPPPRFAGPDAVALCALAMQRCSQGLLLALLRRCARAGLPQACSRELLRCAAEEFWGAPRGEQASLRGRKQREERYLEIRDALAA